MFELLRLIVMAFGGLVLVAFTMMMGIVVYSLFQDIFGKR